MSYYTEAARDALGYVHKEATGAYVKAAISTAVVALTAMSAVEALRESQQALKTFSKDGVNATRRARSQTKAKVADVRMDIAASKAKIRNAVDRRRTVSSEAA